LQPHRPTAPAGQRSGNPPPAGGTAPPVAAARAPQALCSVQQQLTLNRPEGTTFYQPPGGRAIRITLVVVGTRHGVRGVLVETHGRHGARIDPGDVKAFVNDKRLAVRYRLVQLPPR
jgi:hypothetical protein